MRILRIVQSGVQVVAELAERLGFGSLACLVAAQAGGDCGDKCSEDRAGLNGLHGTCLTDFALRHEGCFLHQFGLIAGHSVSPLAGWLLLMPSLQFPRRHASRHGSEVIQKTSIRVQKPLEAFGNPCFHWVMEGTKTQVIQIGAVELDLVRGEFRRDGTPVAVEPQVFSLIAHLAMHPGQVLSRDDLIDAVWNGRIVSDSAIASRINTARKLLGDDGNAQKIIRTIPKRGFRFEVDGMASVPVAPTLPEKPSIAVLPFENMSGDAEQAYFSDGITDDIITELARHKELFVIARHSSFTFRDRELPLADIARTLGVQYIAEGSVRRAGNRIRVTARLVDALTEQEVWAERYDRELVDVFAVQDEITGVIVATLAGQIAHERYRRTTSLSPESVDAYDHVLRAIEHGFRVDPEDNALARQSAEQAVALDPSSARAHAIIALTYLNQGNNFWVADQQESFERGLTSAKRAVGEDALDPLAHAMLGVAELWTNRDYVRAVKHLERAVELNPSGAYFRGLWCYVLAFSGQPEKALEEIDLAIRMNPQSPGLHIGFRSRALFLLRRFEEALPDLQLQVTLMPGHSNGLAYCAATYAALDRLDEARELTAELAERTPHYRLSAVRRVMPFPDPNDVAYYAAMLEKAGMAE